ncbi:SIR2 family protein [Acetobacter sp. TBRC 12305]|uniref:SIR2 family protein n=1 Tax=Acetobacter garciniae TaxID=2817435 RepID=A0A939KR23_9PROT|nr:SIR2 family protein [Acetobacter garciniae]MBO1326187.1 SIR2 family protein [Acetobacter garciniae]MBX0346076.1 SIR2 family protein [Acetobacter garciniae]
MPFKNITGKQEDAFVSSLRAGQYNLLLGAGFSMDSRNKKGILPSGDTLLGELADATSARKSSLQRLYQLLTPPLVQKLITNRFVDAQPGPTAKLMASFVWRRVFTWNVDDVIENVYDNEQALQRAIPKHFNDVYTDPLNLEELFVIHLHGFVGQPEKGYVFSRDQYVNQTTKINPWMTVLTQRMLSEPMIIAGSTLDEPDLDYYLALRTGESARDDRGPSILVEVDDPIATMLCERHGLLHFVGYSNDFFEYCKSVIPNPPTPAELIPLATRQLLPVGVSKSTAMSFNADFELVPGVTKPSTNSRFMYGHVPNWGDLEANRDIARPLVSDVIVDIEKRLADPIHCARVLILSEISGAGKSTVLRRVAFELAKHGIKTLMCSALSRIANTTADVIDLVDGPVVVVIDNLAEQVTALPDLLDRLEKPDVIFVCAERSYRMNYIKQVLAGHKFDFIGQLPMSIPQARRLIERYADAGAIGDHTVVKRKDEFARRVQDDPIALACCRILNDFRPLDRIVDSMTADASKPALERYLAASLAQHCFYGGIRYEILIAAFGAVGATAQFEVNYPLPLDYYDDARQFVIPENAILSDKILVRYSTRDPDLTLSTFIKLANELAPWVNRETIIARAPEPRLSGRLFDFDSVVSKFLGHDAEKFYEHVKPAWEWNSRYWEQVALLNLARYQTSSDHKTAMEYLDDAVTRARHAVAVEHHPFPLTTLGKVLLSEMLARDVNRKMSFDEAFERLSEAISIEERRHRVAAQPYSLIFNGVINYLQAGGDLTHQQRGRLNDIMAKAESKLASELEIHQLAANVRLAL